MPSFKNFHCEGLMLIHQSEYLLETFGFEMFCGLSQHFSELMAFLMLSGYYGKYVMLQLERKGGLGLIEQLWWALTDLSGCPLSFIVTHSHYCTLSVRTCEVNSNWVPFTLSVLSFFAQVNRKRRPVSSISNLDQTILLNSAWNSLNLSKMNKWMNEY